MTCQKCKYLIKKTHSTIANLDPSCEGAIRGHKGSIE
jgi:hypothetical protein